MHLSKWNISATGDLFLVGASKLNAPARIIYLDDHQLFRNAVADQCIRPFLKDTEIIQFSDGNLAWNFIKSELNTGNKIDLVITDINHPGIKGNQLVEFIREQENGDKKEKPVPIMIISMVAASYFPGLLSKNKINYYVSKCAGLEEVIDCLEEILYFE